MAIQMWHISFHVVKIYGCLERLSVHVKNMNIHHLPICFAFSTGDYERSCFGSSINALVHMNKPFKEVPVARLIDLVSWFLILCCFEWNKRQIHSVDCLFFSGVLWKWSQGHYLFFYLFSFCSQTDMSWIEFDWKIADLELNCNSCHHIQFYLIIWAESNIN